MRTNMQLNLTFVFGGMLMASSFLAIESLPSISTEKHVLIGKGRGRILVQKRKYEHHDICLTPGCVKAAASVINDMDPSLDPCHDFYQFACGNFIKTNLADVDKSEFHEIIESMSNKLHVILSEPIQPNEQKPFRMLKSLFKSCMDEEKIEKQGFGPINTILKSLGGWPVLEAENWNDADFTWKDSVYKFRKAGLSEDYFISFSVVTDSKNSTKNVIALAQATLDLNRDDLVIGTENQNVAAYYESMVDIAVAFGANRQTATKELKESLDFEIELAKISLPREDLQDLDKLYNPMKIADLQQKFPSVPWQEYINTLLDPLSIGQDDTIIVESPEYLSGLEILLSNTPKRILANYVIWRAVDDYVGYLTKKLKNRLGTQKYIAEQSRTESQPRWNDCVDLSLKWLPLAVWSLYIRRLFDKNDKTNVSEMVNGIREELYKILEASDWMDDQTRKNAIDKAKSMTNHIAYPDELLDDSEMNAYYENLEVNDGDLHTSITNITKFNRLKEFSKLGKPVNKSDWITHSDTTMVNAYYSTDENSFVIPAAFLQGKLYSSDRPRYMNYASIGLVIGHEITHGFDNQGKEYDKDGNVVDWWGEDTKKHFTDKASCLIEQYGNYTAQEIGLKVNGINTLSENIADNGGAKEAYYAYNEWARQNGVEPRLPGLQKYTPQQMFWLSAANVWCSKHRPETLKYLIDKDEHAPNRFRIIGTFSNRKEFSSDFGCPLGSNMNPVNKCQVW